MKLLRYGPKGKEKPGVLDRNGNCRDLCGVITDITPDLLSPAALDRLRKLDPASLPPVTGEQRFGVPSPISASSSASASTITTMPTRPATRSRKSRSSS